MASVSERSSRTTRLKWDAKTRLDTLPKGTYDRLRAMVQRLYRGDPVDRATATLRDFSQ